MEKTKPYTVTQSVIDAIESIPWNEKFHCYDLFSKSRSNLRLNNNPSKPYDGTIQRIMRSFRHVYNIKCIDHAKSIYMKVKED